VWLSVWSEAWPQQVPDGLTICFFNRVINNSHRVLQSLLPAKRDMQYNLKTKIHDGVLIDKTTDLNDCDFIIGILYKSSY